MKSESGFSFAMASQPFTKKLLPQVKSTGDYGRHRQAEKEGKKHWSRREVKLHICIERAG